MTSPNSTATVRVAMADETNATTSARTAEQPEDYSRAAGEREGMRVLSYLLAGPIAYGLIGWAVDRYLTHTSFLMPIGLVIGLGLSIFMIIRRYGRSS